MIIMVLLWNLKIFKLNDLTASPHFSIFDSQTAMFDHFFLPEKNIFSEYKKYQLIFGIS